MKSRATKSLWSIRGAIITGVHPRTHLRLLSTLATQQHESQTNGEYQQQQRRKEGLELLGCVEEEKVFSEQGADADSRFWGSYGVRVLGGSCGNPPPSKRQSESKRRRRPRKPKDGRPVKSTVCGFFSERPCLGSTLRAIGKWHDNAEYGMRFEASHVSLLPSSEGGEVAMKITLRSLGGVGPKRAESVINGLRVNSLKELEDVLDSDSALNYLQSIEGISKKVAMSIKKEWDSRRGLHTLLRRFMKDETAIERIVQAVDRGGNGKEGLLYDPYATLLGMVSHVSLSVVDQIADLPTIESSRNFSQSTKLSRIKFAQLRAVVLEHEKQSSTFQRAQNIWARARSLLHESGSKRHLDEFIALKKAALLQLDHADNQLRIETSVDPPEQISANGNPDNSTRISLRSMYTAELNCAMHLSQRLQSELHNISSSRSALNALTSDYANRARKWADEVSAFEGWQLTEEQKCALEKCATHLLHIITGGPGTGKSYLVQLLVRMLLKMPDVTSNVAVCAPTGRAAQRLDADLQRMPRVIEGHQNGDPGVTVSTIHRLLEAKPASAVDSAYGIDHGYARNRSNPLNVGAVIVDEASMVDMQLLSSFLDAIPPSARIIFVGDVDQLSPVKPGNAFRGIMNLHEVSKTTLNCNFRQEEQSSIVQLAHLVNTGRLGTCDEGKHVLKQLPYPPSPKKAPNAVMEDWAIDCINVIQQNDVSILQVSSDIEAQKVALAIATHVLPNLKTQINTTDCQVLSPYRHRDGGVEQLNKELQAELNPPDMRKQEIFRGYNFSTLRKGDKVMQSKNNYEKLVFNGDVGVVDHISSNQEAHVDFSPTYGRDVTSITLYEGKEVFELELAWATTVHKCQGGQYERVVLCGPPQRRLHKQLLYTAITRASQSLILVTSEHSMHRASERKLFDVHDGSTLLPQRFQLEFYK